MHKNLVQGVIKALKETIQLKKNADKVLEKTLKSNSRWGSRDRKFIAESFYEIIRWKILFSEISQIKKVDTETDLWKLFSVWSVLNDIPIEQNEFSSFISKKQVLERKKELSKRRFIRESVPQWLDKYAVSELGVDKWSKEIHEMNQQSAVVLRVNSLKASRAQVKKELKELNIFTKDIKGEKYPNALVLKERKNVFITQTFKKGLFEVQDASSQLVSPFLQVRPGMRVIDACAGAGGKTLHIAALMKNKGQIIALDTSDNKLKELRKRSRRNGVHNIETIAIINNKVIKKLKESADRVLIDTPCTGLGVLKRNPDTKWKITLDSIEKVKKLQAQLLDTYSSMVKKGGKLVYSTCSILPSENRCQVNKFTVNHPEFEIEKDLSIMPSESGFDGFYMALLNSRK